MLGFCRSLILLCILLLAARGASAGVAFPDPPGGWTYKYDGDQLQIGQPNSGFTSLDGTWSHDNGSDQWDGSAVGGTLAPGAFGTGNAPGGLSLLEQDGVKYLRLQDTGDPRNYTPAFPDAGNRKLYFGHDMSADGATDMQMTEGVTLSFRARVPAPGKANGPLDQLYRQGLQAGGPLPYPAEGDGYVTSNGGKGNILIKESGGGSIAFSLTTTNDTTGGALTPIAGFAGLTMNEFNGNQISDNVNFGQGSATNVIAVNPTDWHEFWIVLKKDPANVGTHEAYIYVDGNLTPTVFKMTAGGSEGGIDYTGITYLGLGMPATPQNAALDVDFVAYKLGAHFPPGFADPPGGWTYKYDGDQLQIGQPNSGFTSLDGTWSHDNGSDQWDGSAVGGTLAPGAFGTGNAPGGLSLLEQDGVKYLRLQDTGDPRNYTPAFPDAGNRKLYFGHDMSADGATDMQMTEGVTLSFRARVPAPGKANGPLDQLYRQGLQAGGPLPYPAEGDGYVTSNGGKGNILIKESGGGSIAFSLTTTNDTTGGALTPIAGFAGLTMNEFNGNQISDNVNFGQGSATNVIAVNPTDWHTFWIVLKKDPANVGTHEAYIYVDGNLTPTVFKMTAGGSEGGIDYTGITYLGMGMPATPQNAALDVDFIAYKLGAHFPGGALDNLPPELLNISPAYGQSFHPAASGLSVDANTQGVNSLPTDKTKLTLNGLDVSSGLTFTGTTKSRKIQYQHLLANQIYRGEMIVSDQEGRSSTNRFFFDTFVDGAAKVIEAEDYNYGGGQFVASGAPGAYAGLSGAPTVDYLDMTAASLGAYRDTDQVDIAATADTPRNNFTTAGVTDYQIGSIDAGEWWNYTRTLPSGNYYVYLRNASTAAQAVRLDRVTSDATQPSQTLQFLGALTGPRSGTLTTYDYFMLADAQGTPIAVPLAGTTTLRLTAIEANQNLALNYLVLVPAGGPNANPMVSALPLPGSTGVLPDAPVRAAIYDGTAAVTTASVKLKVDGTEVAATVSKSGGITQVSYAPAALWAPNSLHSLSLSFSDGTARTYDWSFTAIDLPVLTPAMKVADARTEGFVWRTFQNEANQDTSILRVENALAGKLTGGDGQPLANNADPNSTGPASATGEPAEPGNGVMVFTIPTVINVNQSGGTDSGTFTPDEQMPGIPGLTGSTDGISVEILTFVQLPRGVVTMGINSDDGFRTLAGFLKDAPLILANADTSRSATDTIFRFSVQEAGVYAFRTLYMEGGGSASIEWFSVMPDGTRVLLNDVANGGLPAFQTGTVPNQPPQNVVITITNLGTGQIKLEWLAGKLQSAAAVNGPYDDVTNATSPYTTSTSGAQKFFRVKVQ